MAVQFKRVAAGLGALVALSAAGYADEGTSPSPDTKALLDYVKKLESRIDELEREREWPLDQFRGQSETVLESAVRSTNLSGFMEYQYGWNFRHGGSSIARGDTLGFNQGRGSDANENTFDLQMIELLVDKPLTTVGSTGYRVRLGYGLASQFAVRQGIVDPSVGVTAQEAYMSWRTDMGGTQAPPYVDLSIGKFYSPFGVERPENTDNWQVTRNPFYVMVKPLTHTGLRATLPWSECCKSTLYFVNGWDNPVDAADGKTVILSQEVGPFEQMNSTLTFNASFGREGSFNTFDSDKTWALEAIWRSDLDERTSFALEAFVTKAENARMRALPTLTVTDARQHGATGYVRYKMDDKTWVSGRLGWLSFDPAFGDEYRVVDATLTLGYDIAPDLTVALEYRHDRSPDGKPFLSTNADGIRDQDTLTASFLYRF